MLFKIVMSAKYICLHSNGIKLNKVQESALFNFHERESVGDVCAIVLSNFRYRT